MSVLSVERPDFMQEEEIRMFEDACAKFFEQHAPPERTEKWRKDKVVERAMWNEAGEAGLLGLSTPEEYGGMGGDYRHEVILMEQIGLKGVDGFGASLHNAIVMKLVSASMAVRDPKGGADLKQTVKFSGEVVSNGVKWPRQITIQQNGQPFYDLEIATFEALSTTKPRPLQHTLDDGQTPPQQADAG